jgi:serine/threonine protein kinase/formylglycine-generating enzyme required for sulfatase activity
VSESEAKSRIVLELAEEFLKRYRKGERPPLREYIDRHPELAADIKEVFPAMALMENIALADMTDVSPASAPGYELMDEIGRGGMGVVYRARDVGLDRDVAVKLLSDRYPADSPAAERFLNEARITSQLQHPGIPAVHQVGRLEDGRPFLAMKLIKGKTLEAIFKARSDAEDDSALGAQRSAADRGRLLAIFEAVCQAVGYAHAHRVIHRDLKPANIMVGAFGEVQVMDWGLAKVLGEETPATMEALTAETRAWTQVSVTPEVGSYTQAGSLVGTPAYVAPEQAVGQLERVNERSDAFGLGALLAEILTGKPPYVGDTTESVRVQAVRGKLEDCFARLDASGAEPELVALCKRCLAFEPADRPADGGEVAQAVAAFRAAADERARQAELERVRVEGEQATAAARSAAQARVAQLFKRFAGGLAVALCLALALAVWAFLLEQESERQERVAKQEAAKATTARDFLVSIFKKAERDERGAGVTVRQLLEEADTRIPLEFVDQPALRADLGKVIDEVKRNIAARIPQAMILEVRGTVQLRSATGATRPAVPQALLLRDDHLSLSGDAQVQLVFLSDLHKERLRPGREATIDPTGCKPSDAVLERDDNSLMTFVRLPKGVTYLGWNGQPGSAKKTEIPEDFELAAHAVTQGQWQATMGNNPSYFSRQGNGRNSVQDISDNELKLFPVESVSWDDVQPFLKKLNEKERGRGYLYRLPTNPEWEYACRGGVASLEECSHHFYFDKPANDLSSELANFDGNWPFGKARRGKYLGRPTRVGAYPSNKLGLCDMHGNMYQWTAELVGDPGLGAINRGGSWTHDGLHCQAGFRHGNSRTSRYAYLGFRLVRVPIR